MKFKILFLAFATIGIQTFAQSLKITKTEVKEVRKVNKEGVISKIIGANKTHFFVTFIPHHFGKKGHAKTIIKSYDIESMTESGTIKVINPEENSEKSMNVNGIKYLVKDDGLYIFINNKNKENDSYVIYGKHVSNTLNTITPYTKIAELKDKLDSYLILENAKYKNMAILYSAKINIGEGFGVLYKFFDQNFKSTSAGQVDLPLKKIQEENEDFLTSKDFRLDQNGNIFTYYSFTINKEDRKSGDSEYATIICYINTSKNTVYNVPLIFDDKTPQDFGYALDDEGKLIVTGFYSQSSMNLRYIDIHGIFYIKIDGLYERIENSKFTPLPEEFKSKLKNDNNITNDTKFKKKPEFGSSLANYNFLNVFIGANSSVTAYCEAIRNIYSSTSYNFSQRGTVYYYNISENGDINWYNSFAKAYTVRSFESKECQYQKYTQVVRKGNKDYIAYETTSQNQLLSVEDLLNADKFPDYYFKRNKRYFNTLTIVDNKNGKYITTLPDGSNEKEKAYQSSSFNNLYFSDKYAIGFGSKYKIKNGWYFAALLVSPLIIPSILIADSDFAQKGKYILEKYDL